MNRIYKHSSKTKSGITFYGEGGKTKAKAILKPEEDPAYSLFDEGVKRNQEELQEKARLYYYSQKLNEQLKSKNPKIYEALTKEYGYSKDKPNTGKTRTTGADKYAKSNPDFYLTPEEQQKYLDKDFDDYNKLRLKHGKNYNLIGEGDDPNKPETWKVGARHAVAFNPVTYRNIVSPKTAKTKNAQQGQISDFTYNIGYDPTQENPYQSTIDYVRYPMQGSEIASNIQEYDWGGALSGASTGASLGASFGPWGAVAGGLIGGVAGSIMGDKKKQEEEKKRKELEFQVKEAERRGVAQQEETNRIGDATSLSQMKLSTDTDLYMSKGGRVNRIKTPSKNTMKLDNNSNLILNNEGSTSGSHEQGDNINLIRNNKTIGKVEPGEVVTGTQEGGEVILSKRIGPNGANDISFADRYLMLNKAQQNATPSMKEEIIKQKKILPKQNAAIADKLKRTGKYAFGSDILNKIGNLSSVDVSTGVGVLGTLGNLAMSNSTLKSQGKDIELMQRLSNEHQVSPIKYSALNTNVDTTAEETANNRAYFESTARLDSSISDPTVKASLRNVANVNRLANFGNIYSSKRNAETDLINQNINALNQNRAMNTQLLNNESERKLGTNLQAISALSGLKSQRLANFQNALGELGSIRKDMMGFNSLKQGYKDTIGDSFTGDNTKSQTNSTGKTIYTQEDNSLKGITSQLNNPSKLIVPSYKPTLLALQEDKKRKAFGGKVKRSKSRIYA